jgi:hypothetical protein
LGKLLQLATLKYAKQSPVNIKEIAAIKCVLDFRLAYYKLAGKSKAYSRYLIGALTLHKCLTNEIIPGLNRVLEDWQKKAK